MSAKPKTDVSVIVPNFNNGMFLTDFLQSIINSTVEPRELIVVDDGSIDNSVNILESFAWIEYLKVIRFEKNLGLTAALNAALEASHGKYVMRADPDDILMPGRIETQNDFMVANPEVDVLGCNVIYFDGKTGKDINTSNFPLKSSKILDAYYKGEHGIQHPTAFVKGNVYRKYRYQEIFPGEDYEIFSRMVKDGCRFANLPQPLYRMRVHSGSSTSNLKTGFIENTFKFRDQIFGTKTSKVRIRFYYLHVLFYRKFQIDDNLFLKYLFLLLSIVFYPKKLQKRIFTNETRTCISEENLNKGLKKT
jgi:glycosyltransferase involved in cell wall biosynthesis